MMANKSISQRAELISFFRRPTTMVAIALTICVVTAAGVTVAKRSQPRTSSNSRPVSEASLFLGSQGREKRGQPAAADMEAEVITITANGLEPSQLRRPAGPFLLRLVNRGRPAEFSFEISRLNGHKLHELKGKKGQQKQLKIIDLPPGEYVLKELNHPELSCKILLSAK
jgi:hypothetical protein